MKRIIKAATIIQLAVAALCVVGATACMLRCMADGSHPVFTTLFAIMALTNYRLLYRPSVREYRRCHNQKVQSH